MVLTKRSAASGDENGILLFKTDFPRVLRFPVPQDKGNVGSGDEIGAPLETSGSLKTYCAISFPEPSLPLSSGTGKRSTLGKSVLNRPLQKRERAGKEYGCFPFV